jgi:hypothetical protein
MATVMARCAAVMGAGVALETGVAESVVNGLAARSPIASRIRTGKALGNTTIFHSIGR